MGNVGRELLYWSDAPGVVQVGIDPGTEWTGLAFVQWPKYTMGTVETDCLFPVLSDLLNEWRMWPPGFADGIKELRIAYERPSLQNGKTWRTLGRISGFVCAAVFLLDGWRNEPPAHREVLPQQVRARVSKVDDLLSAMQPLDLEVEELLDTRPVHAREALATLIR